MPKLLLATNNAGKRREYVVLLGNVPFQLTTPAEEGKEIDVDEVGATFEENAILKATVFASQCNLLTLADDSGLEVDALGGEPGVLSARYTGKHASDKERVAYLLSKLRDVPWEKRTARFRCVIALAHPLGTLQLCEGECCGIITFEPRGDQGFGYDPIFYIPDVGKVMAELSLDEKNKVSHRGKAAQKARHVLHHLSQETSHEWSF